MEKRQKELLNICWKLMESKKKILIVSAPFYPENSPRANRATELAREFARQENDVKVLTVFGDADYNKIAKDFGISITNLGKRKWRSPEFGKSRFGNFLTRAFYRLFSLSVEFPDIELLFLVKKALKLENNYDLMISSAVPYPVHWGVATARKKNHRIAKVWVADCGDPYMGVTLDSFRKPFYFGYIEKWFCKKTDYLTVPTQGSAEGYYPQYRYKIKVIPQGFNFEEIQLSMNHEGNKILTLAYAGGIASRGIRNPTKFINYIIDNKANFRFHIYTDSGFEFIEPYCLKYPDLFIYHKAIPRLDLIFKLSEVDFLVNFDNGTTMMRPSKLIDYALAKRPILNILAEDPDLQLVDEFFNRDYHRNLVIENIDQFNIKVITCQFIDLT